MFDVTTFKRKVAGVTGAALMASAFAVLPTVVLPNGDVRSAAVRESTADGNVLSNDARATLPPARDPFSGLLPATERAPAAVIKEGIKHEGQVRVRAISLGDEEMALIDDGSVRIVTVGDQIGKAYVSSMTPEAVTLSDGRRLTLDGGSQ